LKRLAVHDSKDDRRDPEILRPRVADDGAYRGFIVVFDASSRRVGQEFFSEGADEQVGPTQQRRFESVAIGKLAAIGTGCGRIDGRSVFDGSPAADRVKLLERQTQRINQIVTRSADRVVPVLAEPFA